MDEPATATPAVEANSPTVTPTAEPTTSVEPTVTPTEPASPDPVVQEPVVEPERPPRAERRIQELSAKLKEATAQSGYVPQANQSLTAPKLSELIGNQESIDPDQLNKLGNDMYQQGAQTGRGLSSLEVQALRAEIQQKDAVSNYSTDEKLLPTMFDELNDKSDSYNSVLDAKIAKVYQERAVKQTADGRIWIDPSVKLADVAQDLVELARSSAESGKAQTLSNLQTLADNSAVTPSSDAAPPSKSFDDMSLKEQESYLRAKGHDV